MSIVGAIRRMLEAGFDMEQALIAAEVMEAEIMPARTARQERNRRYYEKKTSVTRLNKTHSDVSDDQDTPLTPLSDKERSPTPPKEINSPPLPPKTTLLSASAQGDFDALQNELVNAAGDNGIQPHAAFAVGPIAELISAGVDLKLDIIPTIRAKVARQSRPVSSWAYFIPAIREAYERRIGAAKGLPKPKYAELSEADWTRRLEFARRRKIWETATLGPAPGTTGCVVPLHLLQTDDGKGWVDISAQSRSAA